MLRLAFGNWSKSRAAQPIIETIQVISPWFSLAKNEDVSGAQRQRHRRYQHGSKEPHAHRDEPEQIAVESPRPALRIVGAVRLRESDVRCVHWKEPTSTVELPTPNAVK